jgi:CheY-like chemotaxis protein
MSDVPVRILIADDEIYIREGLREALQRPGRTVDIVADGHAARRAIDASLRWLGEAEKSSVELKVDPHNPAGRSTVMRTVREWKGERCVDGDSAITVAGVRTPHECHLVTIGPGLGPE